MNTAEHVRGSISPKGPSQSPQRRVPAYEAAAAAASSSSSSSSSQQQPQQQHHHHRSAGSASRRRTHPHSTMPQSPTQQAHHSQAQQHAHYQTDTAALSAAAPRYPDAFGKTAALLHQMAAAATADGRDGSEAAAAASSSTGSGSGVAVVRSVVPEHLLGKYAIAQSPSGFPSDSPTGSFGGGVRGTSFRRDSSHFTRRTSHGRLVAFRPPDIKNPVEKSRLWELMATYLSKDVKDIEQYICNHIEYTLARTRFNLDSFAMYQATAFSIKDRLIECWNDTQQFFTENGVKRVYFMSLEYLLGRSLQNAIFNLDLMDQYSQALLDFGYELEDVAEEESDPALGNGGLGRLAACFFDSLASNQYPAWGYGIRYNYGLFSQRIVDGAQVEFPDYWLTFGNPWEIERLDVFYPINFYGKSEWYQDANGSWRVYWSAGECVFAVAYDTVIPGYDTFNVLNLRLWSSKPSRDFDLQAFNSSDYIGAIDQRRRAEEVSYVLYPNDKQYRGAELRLKQQYFFSSASLQDILRRFKRYKRPFSELPDMAVIHLNDTHPTVSIPEMMRLLLDVEFLTWDEAWSITTRMFSFTNHTILPEAVEKWRVDLFQTLLPRHMEIVYEINSRFLCQVADRFPGDVERVRRMSIIEEGPTKFVRMAFLAVIGSHTVNGVAALHSEILKTTLLKDFFELWPHKFINITNGVTPRRWLAVANPKYADWISKWVQHDEWLTDMPKIAVLADDAMDPQLQSEWFEIRQYNKLILSEWINRELGIVVDPTTMFDVQVKRIHEYKRQTLNILGVIHRYLSLKAMSPLERGKVVRRTVMMGGKAAPGYEVAKATIKLANSVADVVNADNDTNQFLKFIFLPNYSVSLAELVIPATDLSQHISTAGYEASGTSNMKFMMNGSLILGTMDGANVEIAEQVGPENMFIFGALKDAVPVAFAEIQSGNFVQDERLTRVLDSIRSGMFGRPELYQSLLATIYNKYIVAYDFPSYLEAQDRVDVTFRNTSEWIRMAVVNTAKSGFFSSDRSVREYAERVWKVKQHSRPDPYANPDIHLNVDVRVEPHSNNHTHSPDE